MLYAGEVYNTPVLIELADVGLVGPPRHAGNWTKIGLSYRVAVSMTTERLTKSHRLHNQLLELVENGQNDANERFPSVREIARKHNVSTITASKVVSNLIAQGYLVKREGVGTFVAPGSRGQNGEAKREAALCVGKTHYSLFFYELFAALVNEARKMGLSLSVFGTGNPIEEASLRERIQHALDDGFQTLLVGPMDGPTVESVADLLAMAANVVVFGSEEPVGFDSVTSNVYKAGRLAGEFFAEMGHREILLMQADLPARTEGFLDSLAEHGVELPPHLVIPCDGSERSGHDVVNYAMKAGMEFTGVMTCANESTIGALFAIQGANRRVPDDVSIISFNDAEAMRSICPVTSISIRPDEIAKEALAMVDAQLADEKDRVTERKIEPMLVDRGSVKQLADT